MTSGPPPGVLVLWAGALLCWVWLWRGARSRARLLEAVSTRRGGFVRTRFLWYTLTREAREVSFVRMVGPQPVRFRVGYSLPAPGGGRPATLIEFETAEAVFGPEPGMFTPRDGAGGRGLFAGGVNLTEAYLGLLGELPPPLQPSVSWRGAAVRLVIPVLLGGEDEPWFTRCLAFMEEAADRTAPRPPAMP